MHWYSLFIVIKYHWIFQININTKLYVGILKNMPTIKFYKLAFILRNLECFRAYLRKYSTNFILHISSALFAIDTFLIYSSRHIHSRLIYITYLSFDVTFTQKMYKILVICNNFWNIFYIHTLVLYILENQFFLIYLNIL